MDEMDEYQEWLHLTWGFGSEATYLTRVLSCNVQQVDEVEEREEG